MSASLNVQRPVNWPKDRPSCQLHSCSSSEHPSAIVSRDDPMHDRCDRVLHPSQTSSQALASSLAQPTSPLARVPLVASPQPQPSTPSILLRLRLAPPSADRTLPDSNRSSENRSFENLPLNVSNQSQTHRSQLKPPMEETHSKPSSSRTAARIIPTDLSFTNSTPRPSKANSKNRLPRSFLRLKVRPLRRKVEPTLPKSPSPIPLSPSPDPTPQPLNPVCIDRTLTPPPPDIPSLQKSRTCLICAKGPPFRALIPCARCPAALHTHCQNPPISPFPIFPWRCPRCLNASRNFASCSSVRSVGTQTDDRVSIYMADEKRDWLPLKLRNKPNLADHLPVKPRHRSLPKPTIAPARYEKPIRLASGAFVPLRYCVDGSVALHMPDDYDEADGDLQIAVQGAEEGRAAIANTAGLGAVPGSSSAVANVYNVAPLLRPCEYCYTEHLGTFGSGRFCSSKCARTVGGLSRRKGQHPDFETFNYQPPLFDAGPSLPTPAPVLNGVAPSPSQPLGIPPSNLRGKGRTRGRGRGRGGKGRGRGRARARTGVEDIAVADVSDEADQDRIRTAPSTGPMHRSRYGRVVRNRTLLNEDGINETTSHSPPEVVDAVLLAKDSGSTADSLFQAREADVLPGDGEDSRVSPEQATPVDHQISDDIVIGYREEKPSNDFSGRARPIAGRKSVDEGSVQPRKSNRQRKRPASLLDNANNDYVSQGNRMDTKGGRGQASGDSDGTPTKKLRLDSNEVRLPHGHFVVRIPQPGVGSNANGNGNSEKTGGVRFVRSRSGSAKRKKSQAAKPGKGYKFCHVCEELIANRRFVCTKCGTENPSAKRVPRVVPAPASAPVAGKEEGTTTLKVRLTKPKVGGNWGEDLWKGGRWMTPADCRMLESFGCSSVQDLLNNPPHKIANSLGSRWEERRVCILLRRANSFIEHGHVAATREEEEDEDSDVICVLDDEEGGLSAGSVEDEEEGDIIGDDDDDDDDDDDEDEDEEDDDDDIMDGGDDMVDDNIDVFNLGDSDSMDEDDGESGSGRVHRHRNLREDNVRLKLTVNGPKT